MRTLYDVQEMLKKYGFINFMTNRLDAIYFMRQELSQMVEQGIFEKSDKDYLTAQLILRREERIEEDKQNG
ncbi:YqgQ family protein [Lactococcus ileimucosae]|uniref:YqgQ family protein n=1 Tax=Lactococcus ileimucosae TaxID=2941329 RepID=A0ABV4D3M5_9LACT|nr:YqgQ family protein [Lactococcus ileimucosae]